MKLQHKYMGLASPPKETIATAIERSKLLVEVKAETYYGLRTITKNSKI